MDYRYNIRGWLSAINDAALSTAATDNDLFGLELHYDKDLTGTNLPTNQRQFNGNIAVQQWKSRVDATPVTRGYAYSYDPANRLTSALYTTNAPLTSGRPELTENFSVGTITYDLNG
ncbi:MAG: hypothetical protein V4714_10035, partial [Bacteroidota bacterium]